MFNVIKLDDGRDWLTDGHVGIGCDATFRVLGIMHEIAACNCNASISNGVLQLEDGTIFDLKQLLKDAQN
jgi:hypothetical protein